MLSGQYCCREFEMAVDYNDIKYYRVEDDRFNAVKKDWRYIVWFN
jgi:hypothetical protein